MCVRQKQGKYGKYTGVIVLRHRIILSEKNGLLNKCSANVKWAVEEKEC